jgi:universal stress protein A
MPQRAGFRRQLIARAERDGKKLLARFYRRMSLQASAPAFVQVGKPAAEIVRAAQYWPADLILIGTHGREGLQRVLLGSVAEAVVRHAPCPVIVIRAKE